jgi:hypothetical protein
LLLLVRCLMLVALAMLLAGPLVRTRVKGWVFGSGPVGDSLVKAGWERHFFQDTTNYWDGFRVADGGAPAGVPFYIRTTGLARRFAGERPVTGRDVRWDVDLAGDSVNRWTQAAWVVSGDSVRVVEGISRSTGTVFQPRTVGASAGGDTSVLRVAVVADAAYREDARDVKAALAALQKYTRRRMVLVDGGGDWLIWLSDKPVKDVGRYKKVLDYAAWKKSKRNAANDLLWSGEFPVWLGKLLFAEKGAGEKDLRVLDPEQVVPLSDGRVVAGAGVMESRNVDGLMWGIILVLFITERILSHGKEKT